MQWRCRYGGKSEDPIGGGGKVKRVRQAPEVKEDALRQLAAGEKPEELAERLGVHVGTVYNWKKKAKGTGLWAHHEVVATAGAEKPKSHHPLDSPFLGASQRFEEEKPVKSKVKPVDSVGNFPAEVRPVPAKPVVREEFEVLFEPGPVMPGEAPDAGMQAVSVPAGGISAVAAALAGGRLVDIYTLGDDVLMAFLVQEDEGADLRLLRVRGGSFELMEPEGGRT